VTEAKVVVVGPPPTSTVGGTPVISGGSVTLTFTGVTGYTYEVEAATNLVPPGVWEVISPNTVGGSGQWQVTDQQATNYPNRFYRSVYRQ
jgi:hypothetical protein